MIVAKKGSFMAKLTDQTLTADIADDADRISTPSAFIGEVWGEARGFPGAFPLRATSK
jgi:hypothetical protein